MIEGAYKKLKSYYFHDKSILFMKEKIALFEAENDVEEVLKLISDNLYRNNKEYFNLLYNRIDYQVAPKKLVLKDNVHNIILDNVNHYKSVTKINFYINMPIELYIVDTLWMLLVGKIFHDNFGESQCSYAARFKPGIFRENIDFSSNRSFEPYFNTYPSWRDNAFKVIENSKDKDDLLFLSIDFKNFYYSVEFDFSNLKQLLKDENKLDEFVFITEVVENIYRIYTEKISTIKKGISAKQNGKCIFPIGMLSPLVLREIYLTEYDNDLLKKLKPLYYGRYVDDILLILKADNYHGIEPIKYIDKALVENGIIEKYGENNYKLKILPNIKIQSEKIICFLINKNTSTFIIDAYKEKISNSISEPNIMPDMNILEESFSNLYSHVNNESIQQLLDIILTKSDNYEATLFVKGLKQSVKNTYDRTARENDEINRHLDRIIEFYNKSLAIEFSDSWKSVFELFVLCDNPEKANVFYTNIKRSIQQINFDHLNQDEIYSSKFRIILSKIIAYLEEKLKIAMSIAVSLNYDFTKNDVLKKKADSFRKSNMFDHNLIAVPLINYSISFLEKVSLLSFDVIEYFFEGFDLDDSRVKWSPRFIHLEELYLIKSLFYFNTDSVTGTKQNNTPVFQYYLDINNLDQRMSNPIVEEKQDNLNPSIIIKEIKVKDCVPNDVRVALVNTDITAEDAFTALLKPENRVTYGNRTRLFKILNIAKETQTKILTFPEYYLPLLWIGDVAAFAKRNGITIITGLEFVKNKDNKVKNFTGIIKPTVDKKFRSCIPFFREKNYYAPDEKLTLCKFGFKCEDQIKPLYHILKIDGLEFSNILCFEFTDISTRCSMKTKVDILFIPQFNKDTTYFASIVESTSRDLHCFVVQSNTSIYGDSRVTAPYKTDFKNIVQIKGGINDVVIVGSIKIDELRQFQKHYSQKLDEACNQCFKCENVFTSYKKMYETCSKCKSSFTKGTIKALPPAFHRYD